MSLVDFLRQFCAHEIVDERYLAVLKMKVEEKVSEKSRKQIVHIYEDTVSLYILVNSKPRFIAKFV